MFTVNAKCDESNESEAACDIVHISSSSTNPSVLAMVLSAQNLTLKSATGNAVVAHRCCHSTEFLKGREIP